MSYLPLRIEMLFRDIKDLLNDASRRRGEISPIYVRDMVAGLEAEVEEALKKAGRCHECEEALPPLCPECAAWELQAERDHREEVDRAFAATNGTL